MARKWWFQNYAAAYAKNQSFFPSEKKISASGGRILKTVTEFGSSSIHSGGLSPFGQSAASTIRDTREREKKEMSDLNDRLASYIEKVLLILLLQIFLFLFISVNNWYKKIQKLSLINFHNFNEAIFGEFL